MAQCPECGGLIGHYPKCSTQIGAREVLKRNAEDASKFNVVISARRSGKTHASAVLRLPKVAAGATIYQIYGINQVRAWEAFRADLRLVTAAFGDT